MAGAPSPTPAEVDASASDVCWACPHPKAHHAPGGGCQEHVSGEALCSCCNEFPDHWQPINLGANDG